MKLSIPTLALALTLASPALSDITQGISTALLDRFSEMALISMSTYVGSLCIDPAGLSKITDFGNETGIYGFLVHDDVARELILAFRGTESIENFISDSNWTLAPFDTLPECEGCEVFGGYYLLWISIVDQVQSLMQEQASNYPGYGIVITGHSLGGGVTAMAAAQFYSLFPNITVYTMGEPRAGNQAFASYINNAYTTSSPDTTKYFRCTHEDDGVPNVPTEADGYVHHGLEFWSRDPEVADSVYVCTGEGVQCDEATGSSGINLAHLTYFNHTYIIGAQCS